MRHALPVLAAALALTACGGGDEQSAGGSPTTAAYVPKEGGEPDPPRVLDPRPYRGPARAVFDEACGGCHRLRAAGAHGFVGPDLDALRPTAARVRRAIETGGARNDVMPSNLLVARDAERVARYVARTAGR